MNLFKAHFIHPHTQMPLIIYFNKSKGHVTFEKDDELIRFWLKLENQLAVDKQFLQRVTQPANMIGTQYPVTTFIEVYELLEKIGINKEELAFKELHLH